MKIAITDANIFIDLIYVELLDALFAIEVEIHTTINVVDELNESQQKAIFKAVKKNRLTIHTQEEFNVPDDIKKSKKLSDSDKSVFSLAFELDAFILSGDGVIRKISGFQRIEVHGILWLFDKFLESKLITGKKASQKLRDLGSYNKRLPTIECEKRFVEWERLK
ncbi:MAG: hypothetical protein JSS79_10315 [Bacteroidetes bacterium]|nr:hypothetical protein [Bacteroidota bacterium]